MFDIAIDSELRGYLVRLSRSQNASVAEGHRMAALYDHSLQSRHSAIDHLDPPGCFAPIPAVPVLDAEPQTGRSFRKRAPAARDAFGTEAACRERPEWDRSVALRLVLRRSP